MTTTIPTKNEMWLPVAEYEGFYEVSDHGRVRSLDRLIERRGKGTMLYKGVMLRPFHGKWRTVVLLHRDGQPRTTAIHKLVLEAFVGPWPEGMECCHNDGDHTNNRVENLRWDTHSNNVHDIVRHGRHQHATKTVCANGHPFTSENTYVTPRGKRACRVCTRANLLKYRAKKRHTKQQENA
jgi:hypothetical protein